MLVSLVVFAIIAALFLSWSLATCAAAGSAAARAGLWGTVAIVIAGTTIALWVGLIVSGMSCDESCDPRLPGWWHDPDSWQWTALAVLPGMAWLSSLGTAAFVRAGRYGASAASAAVVAALLIGWVVWVSVAAP